MASRVRKSSRAGAAAAASASRLAATISSLRARGRSASVSALRRSEAESSADCSWLSARPASTLAGPAVAGRTSAADSARLRAAEKARRQGVSFIFRPSFGPGDGRAGR